MSVKVMTGFGLLVAVLMWTSGVQSAPVPAFTGPDFSGTYACTGPVAHEGKSTSFSI